MKLFDRYILWPLLLACHLLAVTLLAWHLLAQVNFGYALAYPTLSIEEHIREYGPQNQYKQHFADTDAAEHHRLFAAIARAVQNRGRGLADITYPMPDGGRETLLREPEVVHLDDVGLLIHRFYTAGLIAVVFLVLLLAYARWQRQPLPSPKRIALGFAGAAVSGLLLVLLIGPVRVFYWLHDFVFPAQHQWFFYYQESLMTTLMKAPDLFGFISVLLLVLMAAFWTLSYWGMNRLLSRRLEPPHSQINSQPRGKSGKKDRSRRRK